MNRTITILIGGLLVSLAGMANGAAIRKNRLFTAPEVFLTVNADAAVDDITDKFLNRMIEVNWVNIQVNPGNWIGLFQEDPTSGSITPIVRIVPTVTEGSVKTRHRLEVVDFRQTGIPEEKCLGYWAAFFVNGSTTPVGSNCLKIYPDWMVEIRETIGEKTLTEIMIPGTHNAGAWKIYEGRVDDDNLALKYDRNQEDTIYTQLIHGIRYFDLRIAYYDDTPEEFWINHGKFRMHPLRTLIDDVKEFVAHRNEIIILDIHALPVGFSGPEVHEKLIKLLCSEFSDFLHLKSSGLNFTLNRIWETRKTVFLTYPTELYEEYDFLWPSVHHAWGSTNKLEELEAYFAETLPQISCRGNLVAAMAELTPTAADVFFQPEFGLRGFAQMANLPVTQWFRRDTWYPVTNIVATDFYLGNDIIRMSINVNLNRQACELQR